MIDVIPHRPPSLWLSGVVECDPGKSASGFYSADDEVFVGHFPGNPILMGVREIEALAQLGCFTAMLGKEKQGVLFAGIEKVDFLAPVFPGSVLELYIEMLKPEKEGQFKGVGHTAVNGTTAMTTTITGAMMPIEKMDKLLAIAKRRQDR